MPISLLIEQGSFAGRRYVFDKDEVSFGRTEENDVVVPSEAASRNHARLSLQGDAYQIEDMKSSNGTRVNGEPLLRPLVLEDGDVIEIGKVRFKFSPYDAANATRIVGVTNTPQWEKARAKPPDRPVVRGPTGVAKAKSNARNLLMVIPILAVVFLAYKIATRPPTIDPNAPQVVSGPVRLGEKADPHSYGTAVGNDRIAPHGVVFTFNFSEPIAGKSMLTLHAQTSAIQQADDVDLLVNEKHVQFLPATFEEQRPLDLVLERSKLLPNAENTLAFRPTGRAGLTWTVTGVWVEQESLPSGTLAQLQNEANERYKLAESKYQNSAVAAQNLYDSWHDYRRARLILAAIPNPPESLQNLVNERLREVENKLNQRCREMIFTAQEAKVIKGRQAAAQAANAIYNYFPMKGDHPCSAKAEKFLREL